MGAFNIQDITISKGKHEPDSGRYCIMELVSHVAGEAHTDSPACVSPVYAAFFRGLNDNLDDTQRQELKQYIPRLLNTTATEDVEWKRTYFLANAAVKVFAVKVLQNAGLKEEADKLLALSDIVEWDAAKAAAKAAVEAVWAAEAIGAAEAARATRAARAAAKAVWTAGAAGAVWAARAAVIASKAADMSLVHNVINQLLEIK